MCQDRLSKDPSQEDLPARSPTGCTGTGSGGAGRIAAACLLPPTSPPANLTPKSPPVQTPRKKAQSALFPELPLLLGIHAVREMPVESPLFSPALRPLSRALPKLPARDAAEHGSHFVLPTPASVLLGLSSTPQRRAKSRLVASHVRSTPLTYRGWTGWFLSTAILHPL